MKKLLLISGLFLAFGANAQLRLVEDLRPGSESSDPALLGEFNGKVFLSANYFMNFHNYYLTDETGIRTIRTDITGSPRLPLINHRKPFVSLDGYLITLSGYVGVSYSYLTKCNGSLLNGGAFTNNVIQNTAYLGLSSEFQLGDPVLLNFNVIFATKNENNFGNGSDELLIANTTTGSSVLKDIWVGAPSSSPREMTVIGTKCYFSANNGANGRELWVTDGTNGGTTLFSDINVGVIGSNPTQLKSYGTFLVFTATHPTLGRELFKINSIGTLTSLKDINPTGDSNPTNVTVIGASIYFGANNGTSGNELWLSNGTSVTTNLVKDINPAGDGNPANFIENQGWTYFTANDGTNGVELWKTDGTNAGTTFVSNINPTGSSNPTDFAVYNNRLYFTADDGTTGRQLYYVDASSVVHKITINPSGDSMISGLTATSTELFFAADAGTGIGKELYAFNDAALSTNNFQLQETAITLYPNPSKNHFKLSSNDVTIEIVEIYSLQGQLVKSFSKQNQYNISDLAKGLYVVKIKASEGTLNKTLIIE